jgi:hypothetical protein
VTAFDLWTDGATVARRFTTVFNQSSIGRDGLRGVVNSVNTLFYANYTPILSSGSVAIYTSGSDPLSASGYSLDYDSGLFTLTVAPSVQPTASYTTARYSNNTLRSVLVAGFDLMESLWFRQFTLSTVVGETPVPVDETSPAAYIVNSSGSDPQISNYTLSTSRNQINLFASCVQIAFIQFQMFEAAMQGFSYRESMGASIDKSKIPANLKLALDRLDKSIIAMLKTAQYEWYGGAVFGGNVPPLYTADFVAHRYWQRNSSAQNFRNSVPYSGGTW